MRNKKRLILIALCLMLVFNLAAFAQKAPTDKELDKELVPSYKLYLDNPSKLEFKPDAKTFDKILLILKSQFIDKFDDEEIYAGVKKEVAVLLTEAKVDKTKLQNIPENKDIVAKIIEVYGSQVNSGVLAYACIKGMLNSLNDPYTTLLTPKDYRFLMEQMQERSFGGIGIVIELDKKNHNQLTVLEPIEGTPAFRVGLESGDMIVKINGKSTEGISLEIAQSNLRGPAGTKVLVTIKRPGVTLTKDYNITREQIKLVSISPKMLKDKIGYIRMRLFGENTGNEMRKSLEELKADGAKALILDLRNNGGGLINTAVEVSGFFLPKDKLVVSVINRAGQDNPYNSTGSYNVAIPTLVLVNKYSASASEIVTGCLQDYKKAKILGTQTFGKGCVQQIFPNPDASALKITVARYFTPNGRNFDSHGIEPDIEIPMEVNLINKPGDIQLKEAIKILKTQLNAKSKSAVN
jgi:carboxyl-terminal processing protease